MLLEFAREIFDVVLDHAAGEPSFLMIAEMLEPPMDFVFGFLLDATRIKDQNISLMLIISIDQTHTQADCSDARTVSMVHLTTIGEDVERGHVEMSE